MIKLLHASVIIFLCFSFSVFAGKSESHKRTFAQKDPFQSSVFLQNNGIFQDYEGRHIQYYADHDHVNVYFTEQGLIYRERSINQKKYKEILKEQEEKKKGTRKKEKEDEAKERIPIDISTIAMDWIGANPHPKIISNEQAEGYHTYLQKTDNGYNTIEIHGFKTLTYKDIYPGIDVVYSFPDKGGVKYNLIVRPGADPGQIKMKYTGPVKKIRKNSDGDVEIATNSGSIIEHAPVCYTDDNKPVASSFTVTNNILQFNFPNPYNTGKTLTIDPWLTSLTTLPPVEMGFNVDYDFGGNLFVFGAGATSTNDISQYFQIAKYSPGGAFLWSFAGTVPGIWSTVDETYNNYPSNFIVEKSSGKTYTGQGFCVPGSQTIRLTAAGAYDNFISTQSGFFQETWCYAYNCANNAVLGVGGGTTSNINVGVINTATGAIAQSNITGVVGDYQDIACGTYDSAGSFYVIIANNYLAEFPYTNPIYKVNSSYVGNTWVNNSHYTNLVEVQNKPFWAVGGSANGANCLAANGSYLYYYDGYNVAAYSLATGARLGNTTIAAYAGSELYQTGIAVDNCNNLYLGGVGKIKTFTFNGSTFTAGPDIPLGGAFGSTSVYDVRYNSSTNTLYVSGNGFVGTYIASLSTTCNTVGSYAVATTNTCNSITEHVSPDINLNPKVFTYVLTDAGGNVVNQLNSSTDTINTVTGLASGTYTLEVQWNVNCGGSSITQTIVINCNDTLAISPDTAICSGQSVNLTATASMPGGTYSWAPGGATTQTITVSPTTNTTYTVSYTPLSGPVITDTVTVSILHAPTVTVNDTTICQTSSATLSATPSIAGGTYSWAPGGAATQSITVTPATNATYTVTYTYGACGSGTATGTVTVLPPPTVSVDNDTICFGTNATLTATPSRTGGTYSWATGGATTQSITVSPATTTTYTVTYSILGCANATATGAVKIIPLPTVTVGTSSTICFSQSASLTATPSIAGGTYNWAPGGMTTQTITVSPTTTTTYTVTYTTGCGSAVDSGVITVNPTPTVAINTDTICFSHNGTLTATPSRPGGTYSWTPGGATTQSITISPATNTTYTVTYSIPGCLAANNSSIVDVIPLPTVTTANAAICQGSNATLNANGLPVGGTYSWAPGAGNTQSITVSPATTTTYTVTYTTGCGTATDTSRVAVTAPPTLLVNSDSICFSQSSTLTVTPSYAGGTYSWAPGGATTQSITVTPATTTTYTVTYTTSCFAVVDSGTVTVAPTPTLTVNSDNICFGHNALLTATPSRPGGTYSWTPGGASTQNITVSPAANTTYSVSYSIPGCLVVTNSGDVNVTPLPTVAFTGASICQGSNATLNANGMPVGGTYSWAPGAGTTQGITVSPATTTTYTVTYTTGCGTATDTGTVFVTPPPTLIVNSDSICFSQSATLTVTPSYGGGTYSWAPGGETIQSITVTPATTTTYTVAYTTSCFTVVDSGTVTVAPTPTLTVNSDNICFGQNALLTATPSRPGGTYSWTPSGASTQNITVSPATNTTYSVSYSIPGCLVVTNSGDVNVTPLPTVAFTGASICQGSNAVMNATGTPVGGTFSWAPGAGTTQSATVSPATTTMYTVTYITGCGTTTDTGTVFVTPPPTLSVNSDSICFSQSATLTVTPSYGGGTYSWAPGGETTQSITVAPATTTTYTVAYTTSCFTVVDSGTVTVAPTPTVTVNTDTVCQRQSATLTATTSRTGGTFSWSPGNNITQSITVSPTSTTTYTVTYAIPGCLVANNTGEVDVVIPPIVTVDSSITCQGSSATISATTTVPGGNYSWAPSGDVTQSITVSPASTTTYTVTYSIPQSVCPPVTASGLVSVFAPPSLSVNSTLVCLGADATLTATPSPTGGTYVWSPGNNTSQSITVSPAATTTYTVAYTYSNCSPVSASGTVTIAPLPIATISIIDAICTASNGQEIAQVSSGTTPYSYLWNNPSGSNASALTGLPSGTAYSITVTDANLCTATATGTIGDSITPLPIVNTLSNITCYGLENGSISVSVANCNSCSYQWSNGTSGTSLSGLSANDYTVTVTDQNGCTSSGTYTITAPAQATLTILPNDSTVAEDSLVILDPVFGPYSASSIVSYSWTPSAGLSCTNCPQPVFSSTSGTYTYSLAITYNQGCQITDSVTVIVTNQHIIYVPNAFTPNGDGVNDVYKVFPRGSLKFLDLAIYDRWGEKVFESYDPDQGWDGTFRGQKDDPGVYVYVLLVTFDDNFSYNTKGSISLIR